MGRAAVNIVYQIGVETTPGTGVAANRQLPSLSFSVGPELRTQPFRANGYKVDTILQLQREMAKGKFEGPLTYNEVIWPLAGIIGGTVSTSGGASTWTFNANSTGADTNAKTFTLECGDASAAQEAVYTQFNNLSISVTKSEAKVSGDFFARSLENTTLTSSPTQIAQLPTNINEFDIYLDDTFGGIGTTKLTDPLQIDFAISDKYLAKEVLNTTFQSFKESIEQPYNVTGKVMVEYNSQWQAVYAAMKASGLPTRYLRLKATGPTLGATTYLFQMDVACKLEMAEQKDQDGVYGYELGFRAIHDSSMGRAYSFQVINAVTAL